MITGHEVKKEIRELLQSLEERGAGRSQIQDGIREYMLKKTYAGQMPTRRKPLSPSQKKKLYVQQNGKCLRCREAMEFREATDDHIIPISKGGSNDISNRRLVHKSCNSAKGDNDLITESKRTGQTITEQLSG